MPKTSAGWQVERPGSRNLTTIRTVGHSFVVKKGSGGNISRAMEWMIGQLNTIEPVGEAGWDGTYAYRVVRGGSNWSEHAAGTAIDWNASQHPMGKAKFAGWTPSQVQAIRRVLATPRGHAFKWGADFTTRSDAMHFEMRPPSVWMKHRSLF